MALYRKGFSDFFDPDKQPKHTVNGGHSHKVFTQQDHLQKVCHLSRQRRAEIINNECSDPGMIRSRLREF